MLPVKVKVKVMLPAMISGFLCDVFFLVETWMTPYT